MGQTAVSVAAPGGRFTGVEEGAATITVVTSRFGEVEVAGDAVITMAMPILGFPEVRHYFLKRHSGNSPLLWFQALEEPDLAFVVIDPRYLLADYRPQLRPSVLDLLDVADPVTLDILVILAIPSGGKGEITANLMAPLLLNAKARIAAQVLLDSGAYDCRWPVKNGGEPGEEVVRGRGVST